MFHCIVASAESASKWEIKLTPFDNLIDCRRQSFKSEGWWQVKHSADMQLFYLHVLRWSLSLHAYKFTLIACSDDNGIKSNEVTNKSWLINPLIVGHWVKATMFAKLSSVSWHEFSRADEKPQSIAVGPCKLHVAWLMWSCKASSKRSLIRFARDDKQPINLLFTLASNVN